MVWVEHRGRIVQQGLPTDLGMGQRQRGLGHHARARICSKADIFRDWGAGLDTGARYLRQLARAGPLLSVTIRREDQRRSARVLALIEENVHSKRARPATSSCAGWTP